MKSVKQNILVDYQVSQNFSNGLLRSLADREQGVPSFTLVDLLIFIITTQ